MGWTAMGVLALLLGGLAAAPPEGPAGRAELQDGQGRIVGTVTLQPEGQGVRVAADVAGVPPGRHGIHLHARGQCEPPAFESAGDHVNPEQRQHGLQNPSGAHAGDLPNLEVGPDGTGRLEHITPRLRLDSSSGSVFDGDGTAVVLHAKPDDQVTDPAGESGDRIACGVIARAS